MEHDNNAVSSLNRLSLRPTALRRRDCKVHPARCRSATSLWLSKFVPDEFVKPEGLLTLPYTPIRKNPTLGRVFVEFGGEGGIRTPGRFDPSPDFKSGAFNRTLPPLLNAGRILMMSFTLVKRLITKNVTIAGQITS